MKPKHESLFLSILLPVIYMIITCHAHGGSHDEGAAHHHEKVSLEQAKLRLQQLTSGKMVENDEHIREHLRNIAKIPEEKMTDEQRNFHFFYLHDLDQDNKMDGLEILHSIMEAHAERREDVKAKRESDSEHGEKESHEKEEGKNSEGEGEHGGPANWNLVELAEQINDILGSHDKNDDGYIDYYEFKRIVQRMEEDEENLEKEATKKEADGKAKN